MHSLGECGHLGKEYHEDYFSSMDVVCLSLSLSLFGLIEPMRVRDSVSLCLCVLNHKILLERLFFSLAFGSGIYTLGV